MAIKLKVTAKSSISTAARALDRAKWFYLCLLVALTLAIVFASFVRERAQLLIDISFWLFTAPFLVSLVSTRVGFLLSVLMLTVSPALHHQLNAVVGTSLNSWAYAGVDSIIGFSTAWILKGGLKDVRPLLERFPAGALLALHLWVAVSSVIAVCRNLWQSASELTLRGLAYNVWVTRGLSFHDDYFPLQDLFFFSVAVIVLFCVWAAMCRFGERLLRAVAAVVLLGAVLNAFFAVWQKFSDKGWYAGARSDINAMWADIHSFGGLMAMAIAIGFGLLFADRLSTRLSALVIAAMSAAFVGLYLSGSRSTLLIVVLLLGLAAIWAAMFWLRGWRRVIPAAILLTLAVAVRLIFSRGYRGVTFETFSTALDTQGFEALNAAVSHRPEIWRSALEMYSSFPIFGLGQGTFHRLSSIAPFSGSEVLVSMEGAGAHNYFLQSLVELGLVGLVLAALIAIPSLRLRRRNFSLVAFYALVGVAIGNVYGQSLLVREMLMLAAVFAGAYIWEAQARAAERWRPPESSTLRYSGFALAGIALAALVEVALSFNRMPFTYGQQCFEAHGLEQDGWTRGTLRVAVPAAAGAARVTFAPGAEDIARRSLDVELALVDGQGRLVQNEAARFERGDLGPRTLNLKLDPSPDAKRFLEVRPSHCFVPLNLGLALNQKHDTRRLGLVVRELSFMTPEGSVVR